MGKNEKQGADPHIATTSAQGSYVQPQYVERTMKFYALPESELHTISLMNTLALVFFSVGSALLSIGIGIRIDSSFQEALTPSAEVLSRTGAPILWVLAVINYCVGYWALRRRGSLLATIRDESRVLKK